jgi:gluconokinase
MFIVLMGVAGAGKTTIGRRLGVALGWPFYDADNLHSKENIAKMAAGIPLNESDRGPWLERLAGLIAGKARKGESGVLACSALRRSHREILHMAGDVKFVYLKADRHLILQRQSARRGHYMPSGLVDSQFEALEEPEHALVVPAALPPDEIIELIRSEIAKGV